jgi:hypothetical protein
VREFEARLVFTIDEFYVPFPKQLHMTVTSNERPQIKFLLLKDVFFETILLKNVYPELKKYLKTESVTNQFKAWNM